MRRIVTLLSLCLALVSSSCGEKPKKEENTFEIKNEVKKPVAEATAATIPQSENKLGRRVFLLCAACHNVVKGEPHKVGPNLNGFFGKRAGMKEGFVYSEALKNKGIVWSEKTIREWLENPASYVPGTKMAFVGVKKKEQQDALIAYLKEVTKE
ncbi:c-type cytochrome [Costertonia aggregata]|uniref:Cytochrome c family protein n=1 Tax=Costertonia aggregata TaxID=343403 RepID=A0A7H9ANJ1_9FLAO|nr:cytochrome c family protein [Costertonia aggregata]QLG45006.1 cytochrome c family protein [Costertonia aggregata]